MKSELNLGVLFTGKIDASFSSAISQLKNSLNQLQGSTQKVTKALQQQQTQTNVLKNSMKGYIQDVEKLLQIQARWYGAKFVLFTAVDLPLKIAREGLEFFNAIDKAEAKIRRYGAMLGEATEETSKFSHEMLLLIRTLNLRYATPFEDIVKGADRLVAAGVDARLVMGGLLEEFVKFQTAWPEVEMDKFTKGVVGMFNTFKNMPGIKELSSDLEKYKTILDKVTVAMGVGVLEPQDLPKVMQHFGQMAQSIALSVDETMALTVLVTNLGSKATVAARALRGLAAGLVQEDKLKLFKQLGIEVDRTLPLGKQLLSIISQIREKVTGTGEQGISVAASTILGKIVSVERVGPLLALIRDMDMYNDVLKAITNSQGANDRSAKEMNNTLSAQWKTFVNLIKEIGALLYSSETLGSTIIVLSSFFKTLGLSILGVTTLLKEFYLIFESVGLLVAAGGASLREGTLKPFEAMGKIIEEEKAKITQSHNEMYDIIMGNKPIPKTPILTPEAARLAGRKAKREESDIFVPPELEGTNKNIFPALIASQKAIANAKLTIQKEFDHLQLALLENRNKLGMLLEEDYSKKKLKLLQSSFDKERKIINNEWAITSQKHEESIAQAEKEDDKKKALAAYEADRQRYLANLARLETQKKIEIDNTATSEKLRNIKNLQISLENSYKIEELYRQENLSKERFAISERKALIDWLYNNGKMNEKEFYEANLKLIEESKNKEKQNLQEKYDAFVALSNKEIEKTAITEEKKTALVQEITEKGIKLKSDLDDIDRKTEADKNVLSRADLSTDLEIKRRKIENYYAILEILRNQDYAKEDFILEQKSSLNDWLYSKNLIKAKEFFTKEQANINNSYQLRKKALDNDYKAFEKKTEEELALLAKKGLSQTALLDVLEQKTAQYYASLDLLEQDRAKDEEDLRRQKYESIELLYSSEGGLLKVIDRGLQDITARWDEMGTHVYEMTLGMVENLQRSMSDILTDLFTGKLRSFKDYWEAFSSSLVRIWADAMSQIAAKWIAQKLLTSAAGGGGTASFFAQAGTAIASVFHEGGVVGVDGMSRMVPASVFASAKRFHLGSNEVPAILEKGEKVISKKDAAKEDTGTAGANVTITNLVDPRLINQYLTTKEGKDSFFNIVSSEKMKMRRILFS